MSKSDNSSASELREAAQSLLEELDDFMYMNDYSGLEVNKRDQPIVTRKIEALRAALNKPRDTEHTDEHTQEYLK